MVARALKELWRLTPPIADEKTSTVWEGAPLVADRRMWVAFARFEGGRVVHGIASYNPADPSSHPKHQTGFLTYAKLRCPSFEALKPLRGDRDTNYFRLPGEMLCSAQTSEPLSRSIR